MAIQSQPSRISEPFAGSGTKNVIPSTNTTPSASQAASWASGFPPECSQPISAGGCPVPRNDVNGVLNWLSQGFAFSQDGGVWEWSALADYDVNRMVLGSDGLLYWSVAQSGPGFGAGAVDPTTDNGTYWQSPALLTMPLADKSAAGATTEWVKELAASPIYVDSAGSDTNDGFSSATAVKTITKALELAANKTTVNKLGNTIRIASGTYDENVTVSDGSCVFLLEGNVTINGSIHVNNRNLLTIYAFNSSNTLTVNGKISAQNSSTIRNTVNTTVSPQGDNHAVDFLQNSTFLCFGNFTAIGSCTSTCFLIRENSTAILSGDLSLSSSLSGGNAISLYTDSVLIVSGGTNINCTRTGVCVSINSNSVLNLGALSVTHNSSSNVIQASSSFITLGSTTISLSVTAGRFFYATSHSVVSLSDLNLSGTVSICSIAAYYLSLVEIPSSATVTGTVTGKRYAVASGSNISVNGAGANRIPGDSAGSVTSASYGYYG